MRLLSRIWWLARFDFRHLNCMGNRQIVYSFGFYWRAANLVCILRNVLCDLELFFALLYNGRLFFSWERGSCWSYLDLWPMKKNVDLLTIDGYCLKIYNINCHFILNDCIILKIILGKTNTIYHTVLKKWKIFHGQFATDTKEHYKIA